MYLVTSCILFRLGFSNIIYGLLIIPVTIPLFRWVKLSFTTLYNNYPAEVFGFDENFKK